MRRRKEAACCDQLSGGEEIDSRAGVERPGEPAGATAVAVLIAEDEETVRTFAATALERAGFLVLPACNGEAALEIFRNGGVNVDALLTDVQMGYGYRTGRARPDGEAGNCGAGDVGFSRSGVPGQGKEPFFLAKPFTPAKLLEGVRQVLASNLSAHFGNARKNEE